MRSSLYNCHVFHKRFSPREYGFTSRLFMWHLDLDELAVLDQTLTLFSHNRRNVYSFRDDDHLFMGKDDLRSNIRAYLQSEGIMEPPTRISVLTNLRTFGYVFNPVSFFFCFDVQGQPLAVVVEVHNTFGELKPFLLRREDLRKNRFQTRHPKFFYISPFSDLDQRLEIKADLPGQRLSLYVNNYEPGAEHPFFRSSLTGAKVALSDKSLLQYSLRFPFVTLKVITLIHWHAMRLYLKGVRFHRKSEHPEQQRGILAKKHQASAHLAKSGPPS
jgi:DUF1365 family protein